MYICLRLDKIKHLRGFVENQVYISQGIQGKYNFGFETKN